MTFEVKGTTIASRTTLKQAGYSVERLDADHTNVTCDDAKTDDLAALLDQMQLEHRMV